MSSKTTFDSSTKAIESQTTLRVGIDVGGTHTDAVILNENNSVLRAIKVLTTRNIIDGVSNALEKLFSEGNIDKSRVLAAMFGTTHCTNAIVERKRLCRVGVLRIGKPSTTAIPPMYNLPHDLVEVIGRASVIVHGGHEYNGNEIVPLQESEIVAACSTFKEKKIQCVAISSVFSPVNGDHENRAQKILSERMPNIPITLSSEIGGLGLLARENAAIVNSALMEVAGLAIRSFEEAIATIGVRKAKPYLTQNDGTLMNTDYARKYPVRTIGCGPTNSIRGAAFLTKITNGIIVDIGGTTTLVGALVNGFPRESAVDVNIGGVTTNFRMPDVLAIGCGGGSIIKQKGDEISIGPESVAFELEKRAVSWGGDEITATDIALLDGYAAIADVTCNPATLTGISPSFVALAKQRIIRTVEEAVDKMKTSPHNVEIALVGGGGIIIPPSHYAKFQGASRVQRPDLFQYAGAIGAAIAQISGTIDRVFSYGESSREEVVEQAKEASKREALKAGAIPESLEIVEVEQIPLSYVSTNALRIRVKSVGDLKLD